MTDGALAALERLRAVGATAARREVAIAGRAVRGAEVDVASAGEREAATTRELAASAFEGDATLDADLLIAAARSRRRAEIVAFEARRRATEARDRLRSAEEHLRRAHERLARAVRERRSIGAARERIASALSAARNRAAEATAQDAHRARAPEEDGRFG